MACKNRIKSTLYAVDTDSQVLTANSSISFGSNMVNTGVSINHTDGSSVITLEKQGIYQVTVNADILATTAGSTTVQLYAGTTAITGAEATYTAVESDIVHVSITALIPVNCSCRCVSNAVALTAQLSVAGAVSNAAIVVEKLI